MRFKRTRSEIAVAKYSNIPKKRANSSRATAVNRVPGIPRYTLVAVSNGQKRVPVVV